MVGREGFEPPYRDAGQIYSLLPLTTRPPARAREKNETSLALAPSGPCSLWSRRRDLNPQPSDYKSDALPLSYAGDESERRRYSPVLPAGLQRADPSRQARIAECSSASLLDQGFSAEKS